MCSNHAYRSTYLISTEDNIRYKYVATGVILSKCCEIMIHSKAVISFAFCSNLLCGAPRASPNLEEGITLLTAFCSHRYRQRFVDRVGSGTSSFIRLSSSYTYRCLAFFASIFSPCVWTGFLNRKNSKKKMHGIFNLEIFRRLFGPPL